MLHLHNILSGVWLIEPSAVNNYLPLVSAWLKGNTVLQSQTREDVECAAMQGNAYRILVNPDTGKTNIADMPKGSVAIIAVRGAMTKYNQVCGDMGMATKANFLKECFASQNIKAVIFDIDSPGGECIACTTIRDAIAVRNKPVAAFFNDCACSAAYIGFSGCDVLVANNETCNIGSIGVYSTIIDYRKQLEMDGINLIEVYANASSKKNEIYREALKGNLEPMQKNVDEVCQKIALQTVADNRAGKVGDVKEWGTGKEFNAVEAKAIGLIDEIDTLENVVNYFN